jgi:hypothetical protein
MTPLRVSGAFALSGLLAACGVAPEPTQLEALSVVRRFDVAYTGRIDVELDDTKLADAAATKVEGGGVTLVEDDGTPQVRIDTRVLRMSPAEFLRLFGLVEVPGGGESRPAPSGGVVATEELDRLIDALIEGPYQVDLLNAPSILVLAGHSASTWAVRQLSMVRGHTVQQVFGSFVSSPKVQVAEVGFGLDYAVAPAREDGRVEVELTVRATDLLGGPFEVQGSLAGSPGLTVQVPLVCRQTLNASLDLSESESAFLGSLLVPDGSDLLVVFVSAEMLD